MFWGSSYSPCSVCQLTMAVTGSWTVSRLLQPPTLRQGLRPPNSTGSVLQRSQNPLLSGTVTAWLYGRSGSRWLCEHTSRMPCKCARFIALYAPHSSLPRGQLLR